MTTAATALAARLRAAIDYPPALGVDLAVELMAEAAKLLDPHGATPEPEEEPTSCPCGHPIEAHDHYGCWSTGERCTCTNGFGG
jgi:hypothetical protein